MRVPCMLANHDTASSSFAACASWSHSSGSMGSVVIGTALCLQFLASHRIGAPTWLRRFCVVSRGGSVCATNLVGHRGDGGCCGVGSANFRLRVWTAWIMRNWKRPTSARSLCLSMGGMASIRDSGMSSLAHSRSSRLVAVFCHWRACWVHSAYVIFVLTQEGQRARVLPFLTLYPGSLSPDPPHAGHGISPDRMNFHLRRGLRIHLCDP